MKTSNKARVFLSVSCVLLCISANSCFAEKSADFFSGGSDSEKKGVTKRELGPVITDTDVELEVPPYSDYDDCRYSDSGFNPFFKTEHDESCDLPYAPPMNAFDQAILRVCGEWGSNPTRQDFLDALNDPSVKDTLNNIYNSLKHGVFTPEADLNTFKIELSELWFASDGMKRVFCGIPSDKMLEGMHFYGRYVHAQEQKWVGRDYSSVDKGSFSNGVSSEYIKFKSPSGAIVTTLGKREIDLSHADDIIIRATKAYKEFSANISDENMQCLYRDDADTYALSAKKGAIVTFHPTDRTTCPSGEAPSKCDCLHYAAGE